MLQPFQWSGNTGGIKSPAAVERERKVAEALLARQPVAQDPWSGLAQVTGALTGSVLQGRANEAEQAGIADANTAFAGLADGDASQAEIIAALSNPWSQQNPGQSAVAQALLNQQFQRNDPAYALDLQLKQAQLDAANAPPVAEPFTLGEGQIRYAGDGSVIAEGLAPGGPETVVNNTIGGTDKFAETMDVESAKTFTALMDAGSQAQVAGAKIGQLETLLDSAPQGTAGALTSMAASLGLPVEGANEVQAAEALINQLVPSQRPVGSGTMSDADLQLFKQSLPRIINQPGGNQLILQTMKAINNYTVQQGQIATAVATGQMTPAEGRAALYALPNPLADIAKPMAAPSGDGWQDLGGGVRIRPVGQ
jgi:hypothetical protein